MPSDIQRDSSDIQGTVGAVNPTVVGTAARTITSNATLTPADQFVLADATAQAPPSKASAVASAGGGTFAGGVNYYWVVTATGSLGESIGTIGVVATPAASGKVAITWPAAAGATGYNIYRQVWDGTPMPAGTSSLVASVGNVLTYTDTGTATNTAIHPPTDNGGSFTATLPSLANVRVGVIYSIKATGKTPNLVTLAAAGSDNIEGKTSLKLGLTGADYQSVGLVSSGTQWIIIRSQRVATKSSQAARASNVSLAAGTLTNLVVLPMHELVPYVTRLSMRASMQVQPSDSAVTGITISINECDVNGNYIGNMAFWTDAAVASGDKRILSATWLYYPQQGDVNLEDGSGRYVGLYATSTGGVSVATAISFELLSGDLTTTQR